MRTAAAWSFPCGGCFARRTQSNGPYELHLPIFLQPLGGGCFCPAGRKAPGDVCSNPPDPCESDICAKENRQCIFYTSGFFMGAGGLRKPRHLKTAPRGAFLPPGRIAAADAVRIHPWICFEKFRTKEKLQHLYDAGVLGGAKQPKSEPLPSGASLAAISSKVMVFVPSL